MCETGITKIDRKGVKKWWGQTEVGYFSWISIDVELQVELGKLILPRYQQESYQIYGDSDMTFWGFYGVFD